MKKILCAVLLAAAFCSTITASAKDFDDITGHWAELTIRQITDQGLVNGVSDTSFNPDGTVTRAEFLKMILNAGGIETVPFRKDECFELTGEEWYRDYVQSALDKGILPKNMINSYSRNIITEPDTGVIKIVYTGYFRGDRAITREEMAVLSLAAYQYASEQIPTDKEVTPSYSDYSSISAWAKKGVLLAGENGLLMGMDDGTFLPKAESTRAQAAVVTERLYQKLQS